MRLLLIGGARPNFVKLAPLYKAMSSAEALEPVIVHTGQHYHHGLSKVFFDQLQMPEPYVNLGVGSGSQAVQTAQIMVAFERFLDTFEAGMVVVVGDVNSTVACSLVAKKLLIPVAHVEAGLRSHLLT